MYTLKYLDPIKGVVCYPYIKTYSHVQHTKLIRFSFNSGDSVTVPTNRIIEIFYRKEESDDFVGN